MQTCFKVVALLLMFTLNQPTFSFQDTTRVDKDSLANKEVRFMPNLPGQTIKSLGQYMVVVDDSTTFRISYGLSVLNTVRGKVPNTGISPYSPFATVRENALLVIDGLSYVQSSANSYNMNAFDYEKLSVLSRNASAWYGAGASGGAFIIQSKTGKGHQKPSIEFNSSLTSAVTKIGGSSNYSQSYFSNAIAYMQDFGKIDTRISYNYLVMPSRDNKSHNVKINTGFNPNSKFSARLIIDRLNNRSVASSKSSHSIVTDTIYNDMDSTYHYVYDSMIFSAYESSSERIFTQGNLMLRYQPFRWLTLSSQGSLGNYSESIQTIENGNNRHRDDEQNRSLVNAFATIRPDLGRSFSLSTMFGMQYLSSAFETITTFGEHFTSYQDKYYLSGLNLGFQDFLFVNYTLRKDFQSSIPDRNEKPSHLYSVAFVFSEAFGWHNSMLSNATIRASKGGTFVEYNSSWGLARRSEDLWEIGSDLSFANGRASLSLNYFDGKRAGSGVSYEPSTGYWQSINLPESTYDGLEVILDAVAVRRKDLEYQTTLLWTKSHGNFADDDQQSGIIPNAFVNPRSAGSFLNRITFRNFLLTCLMVVRKDDFLQFGAVAENHTQIKMRDISVGYDLSRAISKIGFREAHISLSMRNFWLMHSTSGQDVETYFMPEPPKSTSLNLYVRF